MELLFFALSSLALATATGNVPAAPPAPCPDREAVQASARQVLDGDLTVAQIRPLDIGGLCEVEVLLRGERRIIYTDASGTVAMLGPLVHLGTGRNLTRERLEALNRFTAKDLEALAGHVAFTLGQGETSFFYVVDPHCRYCKEGQKAIDKLVAEGLVTVRFVLFALNEESRKECVSILCDGKGYAEFVANYVSPTPCEEGIARLAAGMALLRSHGIASTPTYVFSDGRIHAGWLAEEQLRAELHVPLPATDANGAATTATPGPARPAGGGGE